MIFFATLAAAACALYTADPQSPSTLAAKPYEDLEAYRIYSAILPRFVVYVDSAGTLLIRPDNFVLVKMFRSQSIAEEFSRLSDSQLQPSESFPLETRTTL